jgi:5-methyltetrahydropteroyltriglutamate--homocysteine methyltransferase
MALVDDIGSFPLPGWISQVEYNKLYSKSIEELAGGFTTDAKSLDILNGVVLESFEIKLVSEIDVATYPQHFEMHSQFLKPIESFQEEPFLIEARKARIPEIEIIKNNARELSEISGKKIAFKVCVTGPVELYLRTEFGSNIYPDVLENLAKSVNRFMKNSIFENPYISVEKLSLDEPSLGFVDLLNIEFDDIVDVLEIATKNIRVPVEMHLHSLKSIDVALAVEGLTSITGEFAASPENLGFVRKRDLESYDKFLRAGISRTNIDSIIAEFLEAGIEPDPIQLIDEKKVIKKRIKKIDSIFGERVSSWGPDCGLGSWPTQKVAQELLKRTAQSVRETFK